MVTGLNKIMTKNYFSLRTMYGCLYLLVEDYFERYKHLKLDDIPPLGGSMMIAEDSNETLDPAIWYEWLEAVANKEIDRTDLSVEEYDKIEKIQLTLQEGYAAAIRFLTWYANSVDSDEIREFVRELTYDKWLAAADKVLGGNNEK